MSSLLPIRHVLISVFDKSKILDFARTLSQYNTQLLSTDGTYKTLANSELNVHKISDYIQLPEIINRRVKTLHHKIYAGILSRKGIDDSVMHQYNIKSIDMVVINFYPFNLISKNQQYSRNKILEYIDIGGPNIVRAAIKNYENVAIIIDSKDYHSILYEMHKNHGSISLATRFTLASKALQYLTQYDSEISDYFNTQLKTHFNQSISNINQHTKSSDSHFPDYCDCMNLKFIKKQNLRYGENPHQKAALYINTNFLKKTGSISTANQLQGKPLSYNNIIDMDTALECVKTFQEPTCVIVKHTNPCGVATSHTIKDAYNKAYQADPISAFGGIIAFNRTLDKDTAQAIVNQHFVEAIIAPDIHQDCLKILSNKKHIRILNTGNWNAQNNLDIDFKQINNGILIQDHDVIKDPTHLDIVTIRSPTEKEMKDALFCWKIVKFVKSNAIVCGKNYQTTGIGIGQTNRVHAVKIATDCRIQDSLHIKGSSMASDAFFPFPDGIQIAGHVGITCIIQPGGSIQDEKIITAANKYNISMIFTHTRHFRH